MPPLDGQGGSPADVGAILTAVGEVVYEWSFADDSLRWGANALDVLKAGSFAEVATGRAFAALLDPTNAASRDDAVAEAAAGGEGVRSYQVQYAVLPQKASGPRLWIEDIGRCEVDATGRPLKAHGVIRVINERYEREQRLAYLSRYDELTGYFNRSHLVAALGEAIANARRYRDQLAFLLVSVDSFGAINAAYGYDIADEAFVAVGRRIASILRAGDVIGRYSGSKLGVVLMRCSDSEMAAAVERLQKAVRGEVIVTGAGSLALTVSIGGVALPRYGGTAHEAMARAQDALSDARALGIGRFVAHFPSPDRQAQRRANAALSTELAAALDQDRVRIAFQPVVRIGDRKPFFYEALARLDRPSGAILEASAFVETAERLGLIRFVDKRVLKLGLEALKAAPAASVSVNVSADTISDGEWMATLSAGVGTRRDLAERLIIELTESAVMRSLDEAMHFVAMLHDLGCRVAIDDFGAGFSSFRGLRSLDIDVLKIDGSFIERITENAEDRVFVSALVELARTFDVDTVAERVKDEETAALLAGIGIGHIQGELTGWAARQWPPDG